jgi:hypothetical protein
MQKGGPQWSRIPQPCWRVFLAESRVGNSGWKSASLRLISERDAGGLAQERVVPVV